MVPKIITHAASIVAQKRNDHVQFIGREACSKEKRHSSAVSLSGSSINLPATSLKRRSRTAQSNFTQHNVAHFRKNRYRLLLGKWNVFTGKVEIGRRGKEISCQYCWSFFYQETWFWNRRFGWRVKTFLFRRRSKYICSSECGNSHKPSVVRLCVHLESFGIMCQHVEAQRK